MFIHLPSWLRNKNEYLQEQFVRIITVSQLASFHGRVLIFFHHSIQSHKTFIEINNEFFFTPDWAECWSGSSGRIQGRRLGYFVGNFRFGLQIRTRFAGVEQPLWKLVLSVLKLKCFLQGTRWKTEKSFSSYLQNICPRKINWVSLSCVSAHEQVWV